MTANSKNLHSSWTSSPTTKFMVLPGPYSCFAGFSARPMGAAQSSRRSGHQPARWGDVGAALRGLQRPGTVRTLASRHSPWVRCLGMAASTLPSGAPHARGRFTRGQRLTRTRVLSSQMSSAQPPGGRDSVPAPVFRSR
jgi:hypothetical protein